MDEITPVPGPASRHERRLAAAAPNTNPDDTAAAPASFEDISRDVLDEEPGADSGPFAFSTTQLYKLLTYRSMAALDVFGGLYGLAGGLRANVATGLSADEATLPGRITFDEAVAAAREERDPTIEQVPPRPPRSTGTGLTLRIGDENDGRFVDRRRVYGANRLPRRPQKSFFRLMWIAFNDKLLILLTISACISLAIGIYQSVDAKSKNANIEWVDGVTVVVAILVIIFASAATDWQKNHKFEKLNERKSQRDVAVLRHGRIQHVSVYDVMVGDVLHIEAGEVLAADGVLVRASGLHVDESSVSGEAGLVHKTLTNDHDPTHATRADPFLFSGTTICRGVGQYLVTAVGANSTYGRTLISLREDVEETPLQAKLGRLGKQLILFGAAAGSVFFLILFIRFMVNLDDLKGIGPSEKAERFFGILILAITVVIITVPEGLALNVTIALAFATKRMLKDNNLVRLIRSCEIMGNATTVCSDKTGTLTQNKMTVVAGRIGLECSFDDTETKEAVPGAPTTVVVKSDSSSYATSHLSTDLRDLIKDSIALNSTAFETDDASKPSYVGSSTETALLKFSHDHLGMGPLREERANAPVLTMFPFDSTRKWMAVLIKLPNGRYRLLIKGAAEVVFEYCAYTISDPEYRITTARLSEEDRKSVRDSIQEYAGQMLRPVAVAFRDFEASEVFDSPDDDPAAVNLEWFASGLVHVGLFGIRDPLRPEVVDSVKKCQEAGVFVRMITGDNFVTAKAVATECGIYTSGGIAMDGPTFRRLSPEQLDSVIPRLQVLARSSPEDKLLLVSRLRGMKETVAVTGDGTNDALALKAADVGFAMGLQGTEVAKEAASIILLDDNFASIVKALSWGRTVNDAVKKFCQFQFTINITAGIITVVSELVGDSVFTVVQLLWINLIMDIFASLGLATDHPSPDFLKRKPEPRNAPIVSITMWKMILGQSIYQLLVVFLVHYIGWDLFDPTTKNEIEKLQTFVFNIYVWMQFFNQHNCRRVDNKLDIWYQGVLRNPWFIGVQCLTLAGQFIIIFKGGEAFDTVPLSGAQWGWSMLFGILTIPLGALIRQVPDRWVLRFFLAVKSVFMTVTGPVQRRLPRLRKKKQQQQQKDAEEQANKQPEPPVGAVEEMMSRHGRQLLQQLKGEGEDLEMTPEQRRALEIAAQRARDDGADQDKPEREVDLVGLIEAAKVGRAVERDRLEIHPRTPKEDPILGTWTNHRVPPSQDDNIRRYMDAGKDEADEAAPRRRRNRVPATYRWVEPTRPQLTHTRPRARNGFTWEAFLRSKRR